jgi:hypothetical protein
VDPSEVARERVREAREPDNPVYVAGVKCWRRYWMGGWVTRRDAFDCDSIEEFHDLHRVRN